jgi:hypothetical protein
MKLDIIAPLLVLLMELPKSGVSITRNLIGKSIFTSIVKVSKAIV